MHFVYELVDPRTKIVNYVGITNNPNARQQEHIGGKDTNRRKQEWIQQPLSEGHFPNQRAVKGRGAESDPLCAAYDL